MFVSRLAASGLLLLSLLALSLDGKPLKQKWLGPESPPMEQRWPGPKVPPLEQKWLGPEIPPLQPEGPPLMEPHEARQKWARMVHHEQQRGGGGGGWRDENQPPKGSNCFGHRIDRIGSVSGLGCNKVDDHDKGEGGH
uniref:Endogenous tripeptide metalloproteinase inhibitor MPi-5 n=1 Tax=Vipera ammodytes ammodytes TaxID=8705 RepID=A0A6B7FPT0_VIPAA|nr:endogenous tripeptide metalloproteinase inhibitor precursor MPi-5 [Vipera ammodytes ammodytes]